MHRSNGDESGRRSETYNLAQNSDFIDKNLKVNVALLNHALNSVLFAYNNDLLLLCRIS